ncbi:MAG: beta-galactosidase [Clostridia bacterium]|nr:beta-galactosidase [Clostridia bacterium]
MYSMKNGILYQDGKAVFCVGLSYYPSYHAKKVPVPETGDRVGEMEKDIRAMKEAGFNLVRGASIGDVRRVNGEIEVHTEFIEQMLDECDKVDIASMMRLQGYSMNLSGYDDFLMLDEKGNEMDTTVWYDFLQNSMYHEGILRDNDEGTVALAKLYSKHPNLVSFQTYNEPHYPHPPRSNSIYDYHPATIAAYRKWLVAQGIMTAEAAADYDPPRTRPAKGEDITEWVNWRLFSIKTLSNFLNHTADVAKKVDPEIESLTCLTSAPTLARNSRDGVNYFDNAKGMDTVGITHYLSCYGASYYHACLVLDNAESAAALNGKHCWLIEYDARTNITLQKLYQETYAAIGAGIKGIMYYQWRGDHIFPDSPEGNGFGFVNYDGTKTENYEQKLDMVRLLNKLSDVIINAEKKRCGVAILSSDHAFVSADALDNDADAVRNSYLELYKSLYKHVRAEGITVDLTESDMLKSNPLGFKVVIVPKYSLLSEQEKADLQAFADNGGAVYTCEDSTLSLYKLGQTFVKYEDAAHNVIDMLEAEGIEPIIISSSRSMMVQVIEGEGYALACLNNISTVNKTLEGVKLTLNKVKATSATLYTPYSEETVAVEGDTICLPTIKEGAFLLLK